MMPWLFRRSFPGVLTFFSLTAALLPALVAAVPAADPPRPARVAVVASRLDSPVEETLAGFREVFRERSEVVALEVYPLPETEGPAADTIEKIRTWQPQLILALGSPALQRIHREFPDIPVVFGLVLGETVPVPRGRATGVILDFPLETQFEWLRRVLPGTRTVGVVFHPEENAARIRSALAAADTLGLKLEARAISSPQELPAALNSLANTAQVLWGLNDRMVTTPQTARGLLLFSFRNRIPFIGLSAAWVKAGALFALDRDYRDIGRQCGDLARQVLHGTPAGALPVTSPRRVVFMVNQRTAEQMKIDLTESLLKDAATIY
jgi:putative ABC transport system substrate-binding protein